MSRNLTEARPWGKELVARSLGVEHTLVQEGGGALSNSIHADCDRNAHRNHVIL